MVYTFVVVLFTVTPLTVWQLSLALGLMVTFYTSLVSMHYFYKGAHGSWKLWTLPTFYPPPVGAGGF